MFIDLSRVDVEWPKVNILLNGMNFQEQTFGSDKSFRYQSLSKREYIVPSDELQFETYEAGYFFSMNTRGKYSNKLITY